MDLDILFRKWEDVFSTLNMCINTQIKEINIYTNYILLFPFPFFLSVFALFPHSIFSIYIEIRVGKPHTYGAPPPTHDQPIKVRSSQTRSIFTSQVSRGNDEMKCQELELIKNFEFISMHEQFNCLMLNFGQFFSFVKQCSHAGFNDRTRLLIM